MAGHTGCEEDEFKGRLQKLHFITCRDSSFSSPEGAQEHICKGTKRGGQVGRGKGKERVRDEPVCPSKPQPPLSVHYVQDEERDDKLKGPLHWK